MSDRLAVAFEAAARAHDGRFQPTLPGAGESESLVRHAMSGALLR
jgi:hypothetical protein